MLSEAEITSHADRIRENGYTVLERVVAPQLVDDLKAAVERIEREHSLTTAKTSFEGYKTLRVNNLLTYDEVFWEVPLHGHQGAGEVHLRRPHGHQGFPIEQAPGRERTQPLAHHEHPKRHSCDCRATAQAWLLRSAGRWPAREPPRPARP